VIELSISPKHRVRDENQFRIDSYAARSPADWVLFVPGETPPKTVSVRIDGQPVRLGIMVGDGGGSRTRQATIFLTQVVNGSAAQQAGGCHERDRVYEVGGKIFKNAERNFARW